MRKRHNDKLLQNQILCRLVQPWWEEIRKQWPKTVLQIVLPLFVMWICWLTGAGPFNKDFFPPAANATLPGSTPSVPAEEVFTEL